MVFVGLAFLFVFARYFKLWLQGFVSRARIGPFALIGMSLRKVNPRIVAETKIMAVQAGLADITTNAIEAHYLAGGNIRRVVQALIAAAPRTNRSELGHRRGHRPRGAQRLGSRPDERRSQSDRLSRSPADRTHDAGQRRQGRNSTQNAGPRHGPYKPGAARRRSRRKRPSSPGSAKASFRQSDRASRTSKSSPIRR